MIDKYQQDFGRDDVGLAASFSSKGAFESTSNSGREFCEALQFQFINYNITTKNNSLVRESINL